MAEEHRREIERESRKLNATDLARLQERVRYLIVYTGWKHWEETNIFIHPILSSYLKETPKQCIEVYYRIFISALFAEIILTSNL